MWRGKSYCGRDGWQIDLAFDISDLVRKFMLIKYDWVLALSHGNMVILLHDHKEELCSENTIA